MANERILGKDFDLFVGTTEPTARDDSGDTNYTRVGKVVNVSFDNNWSTTEVTDRDSGSIADELLDTLTPAMDVQVNVQRENDSGTVEEDAGHTILINANKPANQSLVYWIITPVDASGSPIVGMTNYYSSGRVSDWNAAFDDGSGATYDFSFSAAGEEVTPSTVPTP